MKFKAGDKVRFTKKFEDWCREGAKHTGTDLSKSPYKVKYVWEIVEIENESYILKNSSFRSAIRWNDKQLEKA